LVKNIIARPCKRTGENSRGTTNVYERRKRKYDIFLSGAKGIKKQKPFIPKGRKVAFVVPPKLMPTTMPRIIFMPLTPAGGVAY
jgi:hypothetical protein